jgi:hypothetical protein
MLLIFDDFDLVNKGKIEFLDHIFSQLKENNINFVVVTKK